MPKNRCINHGVQKLVIIREDYVQICDNNHCAAALLSVLEYWHNVRLDQVEQERVHQKIDNEYGPNFSMAIYKSMVDLNSDLLGLWEKEKIRLSLDLLIEKGFVTRKDSSKSKFDKTKMYHFLAEQINVAIESVILPVRLTENRQSVEGNRPMSYIETTALEVTEKSLLPELSLAAGAAIPEASSKVQTNPSIDGIGKMVRLVSDENLSHEEDLSGKESSAPSNFRRSQSNSSGVWTPLEEKMFWSKYNSLPKAKKPNKAKRDSVMRDMTSKIKATPQQAMDALGGFKIAGGAKDPDEFVKHFWSYHDACNSEPAKESTQEVIRRARTNRGQENVPVADSSQERVLERPSVAVIDAIMRWNRIVKSNPVEYDPRLNGAECRKLSELCRDKDFAEAFDGVCGMCEKICAATAPGDWMPDLWWLTGSKNGTANWYKVFKGKFDWKSKASLGGRRASIFDKLKDF